MAADKDAGASDFRKIPMGLPGVGTLLPLLWHFGVGEGRITENELVDRLSADGRIVFALRYMERMTVAEIAEMCGVSQGTVKRRLARARRRFFALAARHPALSELCSEEDPRS